MIHAITLGWLDQDFDPVFGGLNPSIASCFGTHWIGLLWFVHYSPWFPHGLGCWFKHIKTMSKTLGNSVDGGFHMPWIQGLDLPSRLPSLPGAEIGGPRKEDVFCLGI